jgi:uncharacterized protein (DUF58 family)
MKRTRSLALLAALAIAGVLATSASPAASLNKRPVVHILSAKAGQVSMTIRFNVCDDSRGAVTMVARNTKYGTNASIRHRWVVYPKPCGVYQQSWLVAPRFKGYFWVTLQAHDPQQSISQLRTMKVWRAP